MNSVQIKVCGVTSIKDAKACAEADIDMIGLNFYSRSPRAIAPTTAREIVAALPARMEAVGVFVDASAEEIRAIAKAVGITAVQLHGEISSQTCRELAREFRVIRAFHTNKDFRPETTASFSDCDILLDAHHPELRGGTGQTCDWSMARAILPFTRFLILSGGLNAENVGAALNEVAPNAVDLCSGVESAPGVKDRAAIQKFVAAVHGNEL